MKDCAVKVVRYDVGKQTLYRAHAKVGPGRGGKWRCLLHNYQTPAAAAVAGMDLAAELVGAPPLLDRQAFQSFEWPYGTFLWAAMSVPFRTGTFRFVVPGRAIQAAILAEAIR